MDSAVVNLCGQAFERGILKGDLNSTQLVALSVARKSETSFDINKIKASMEHMDSIFDMWLAVTRPDIHKEVVKSRQMSADDATYVDLAEIPKEDMAPIIEKMKRLAAMERNRAKG